MMKKFMSSVVVVVAVVALLSINAYSQVEHSQVLSVVADDDGYVEISGSFGQEGANKSVTILVLSAEANLESINLSQVNHMGQVFADTMGAYSYSFKMEGQSGFYYARVVGIEQGETHNYHFLFSSTKELEDLLEKLNVHTTPSQMRESLSDPVVRAMLNIDSLGSRTFSDLPDIIFTSLTKVQVTFTDENIDQYFRPVSALIQLYDLNHTSNVKPLLDEYHNDLGINLAKYYDLKNHGSVDLELAGKAFSLDSFVQTFNRAVLAQGESEKKQTLSNQNSGGGGVSSGGGSGGVMLNTPPAETKEIKEPKEKQEEQKEEQPKETQGYFGDLESVQWAIEAVNSLFERGVINGRGDGIFSPNDKVTRGEFVSMLIRAFGFEDSGQVCEFLDVNESDWFYSDIATATFVGITNGVGEGKFGAGESIAREEMAAMAYRAALLKGVEFSVEEVPFNDKHEISQFAVLAVKAMWATEIINGIGDNLFSPKGTATRAQAAKIIYSISNKFENEL